MKKVLYSFLWLFTVGGFLFLTSCGDDTEDPAPTTITLDPSVTTNDDGSVYVAPGETVDVTVNFTGDGEVTVLSNPAGDFTNGDNTAMAGESVGFTVPATASAGDTFTLTFSLDNGVATEQLEIIVLYATVTDVIVASENHTTLESLVTDLGIDLTGAGPYTVFAPNDDAFAAIDASGLSDEELTDIISYHVVTDSLGSGDLETGWYPTLNEDSVYIEVDGSSVTVNGVDVVAADMGAANGVVHEIGSVLLPSVTMYEAFLLASPTGDEMSETFFSTATGELYSYDDVTSTSDPLSGNIDLGYYYGATANATLASPDSYPQEIYSGLASWGTRNDTDFRETTLSAEAFDALTAYSGDAIEAEFEAGTDFSNTGRASGLAAGDVVAFSTTNGRFGLIKVVEVVGTDGFDDGIQIEVKVTN